MNKVLKTEVVLNPADYTTHTDDYGNKYYLMVDTPPSEGLTSDELDDRVEESTERKQIT